MPLTAVLQKIIDWLRAGYPHGVPEVDYLPLFALLSRRLSFEELEQVKSELVAESLISDSVTEEMIRSAISAATDEPALQSDIERIENHLASVGWVVEPVKE